MYVCLRTTTVFTFDCSEIFLQFSIVILNCSLSPQAQAQVWPSFVGSPQSFNKDPTNQTDVEKEDARGKKRAVLLWLYYSFKHYSLFKKAHFKLSTTPISFQRPHIFTKNTFTCLVFSPMNENCANECCFLCFLLLYFYNAHTIFFPKDIMLAFLLKRKKQTLFIFMLRILSENFWKVKTFVKHSQKPQTNPESFMLESQ